MRIRLILSLFILVLVHIHGCILLLQVFKSHLASFGSFFVSYLYYGLYSFCWIIVLFCWVQFHCIHFCFSSTIFINWNKIWVESNCHCVKQNVILLALHSSPRVLSVTLDSVVFLWCTSNVRYGMHSSPTLDYPCYEL